MNLLMLAPDIQERLLFPVEATAMLRERELRPIVTLNLWREQRQYLRKRVLGINGTENRVKATQDRPGPLTPLLRERLQGCEAAAVRRG